MKLEFVSDPKERTRFIRFAIVGTFGAIIDFVVFNLLLLLANMPAVWANICSFTVAVVSNYILNRYWTYPDSRSKKVGQQLTEYVIVNLIGVIIRTLIFTTVEPPIERVYEWLHLPFTIQPEVVGHNLALATAIGVVLFWNFFVNRYWTYADVE